MKRYIRDSMNGKGTELEQVVHIDPTIGEAGSVSDRLERWTCNSEALSSSPALTASWICSR